MRQLGWGATFGVAKRLVCPWEGVPGWAEGGCTVSNGGALLGKRLILGGLGWGTTPHNLSINSDPCPVSTPEVATLLLPVLYEPPPPAMKPPSPPL